MSSIIYQNIKFSIGALKIGVYENQLVMCDWTYRKMRTSLDQKISKALNALFLEEAHPLIDKTKDQIEDFLEGKRKQFELSYRLIGTDFQTTVWESLRAIPYGETRSYEALSHQLQMPKAIRAVASANGANNLALVIPCHRVIGKNGELVGYAGGLSAKKKLLELEKGQIIQQQLFD